MVVEVGRGAAEFLFGAFIALTSSSSSSWAPPASPAGLRPPSSGRRGSRSPRDLPAAKAEGSSAKHRYHLAAVNGTLADTHLIFLWAQLASSWRKVDCRESRTEVEDKDYDFMYQTAQVHAC